MTPEELSTEDAELQFDRAEPDAEAPAVTCAACRATVATEYYDVNAATLCSGCKGVIERHVAPVTEWRLLVRAGLLGLLAAIVGAAIYYGVIAATGFEIGIVAILIGYLVGHALRKGTRGRGGRRLQLLAVVLTYLSVALAYLPLAMREIGKKDGKPTVETTAPAAGSAQAAVGPDAPAARAAPATSPSADAPLGAVAILEGLGALLLLALALPVIVIVSSLPSGLLSAVIIGFGILQAWKITAAPPLTVRGPFRVGVPRVRVPRLGPGELNP